MNRQASIAVKTRVTGGTMAVNHKLPKQKCSKPVCHLRGSPCLLLSNPATNCVAAPLRASGRSGCRLNPAIIPDCTFMTFLLFVSGSRDLNAFSEPHESSERATRSGRGDLASRHASFYGDGFVVCRFSLFEAAAALSRSLDCHPRRRSEPAASKSPPQLGAKIAQIFRLNRQVSP